MTCKALTGEIFLKYTEKRVQTGIGAAPKAFWAIPVRFPTLNKGKSIVNGHTGARDSFLEAVAA